MGIRGTTEFLASDGNKPEEEKNGYNPEGNTILGSDDPYVSTENYLPSLTEILKNARNRISSADLDPQINTSHMSVVLNAIEKKREILDPQGGHALTEHRAALPNPDYDLSLENGGNPDLFAGFVQKWSQAYAQDLMVAAALKETGHLDGVAPKPFLHRGSLDMDNITKFLAEASQTFGPQSFEEYADLSRHSSYTQDGVVFANMLKIAEAIKEDPAFSAPAMAEMSPEEIGLMIEGAVMEHSMSEQEILAVYEVTDPRGNPTPEQQAFYNAEIKPLLDTHASPNHHAAPQLSIGNTPQITP